ncbi:putative hydroxypyruvate isomerase [Nilaparvata lugens]|uniref:putative hydroxypyruvate isomerase n=1 Tax=Nilaparvata lugens TaxID=108931 RepID=UPI000B99B7A8|nr:putative hydroxypyruvate isomerase [Nilaparvata lugens]
MGLKFCANLSFMFQHETPSLLERYGLASRAGFKAVECAFPYDYKIDDLVKAQKNANVEQVLVNVYPGDSLGFAAIPGKEKDFEKSLNSAIQYAKALNCGKIHIMSGKVEEVSPINEEVCLKNLTLASKLLASENIVGLIEPINQWSVPNYFLNNYEKAVEFIKKIDSPSLKLQLDIFHLQQIKGNLTRNIEQLLPYTGHIQIAQVPKRGEPNTPGEINYPFVFSVLKEQNYSGFIGLEYIPATGTVEGLNWLKEYGFTL